VVPLIQAELSDEHSYLTYQRWRVGQIITDRHVVRLPADIPPGSYSLRVGLYEPETRLRMDLLDPLGNPQGTDFGLTAVTVRPGG